MLLLSTSDSAWFVDKVVIKETAHSLNEWVFPGQEFLAPTKQGPARKTFKCMGKWHLLSFQRLNMAYAADIA